MRRIRLAVILASLSVGLLGSASAQEPCDDCCCHRHPVLRGTAWVIRGAVHLVTAPVRLLAHHHHGCGCCYDGCGDGCGSYPYGPNYPGAVGPAAPGQPVAPGQPAAPGEPVAPAAAVQHGYVPVVSADSVSELSADDREVAAKQAIGRGISLYRSGEIEVAREYFREATVLAPDMAAGWGLCGIAAASAKDSQSAAECADRVREITATNSAERSQLYRLLAPIQGESRVAFEQLLRSAPEQNSLESLVSHP